MKPLTWEETIDWLKKDCVHHDTTNPAHDLNRLAAAIFRREPSEVVMAVILLRNARRHG
jgi:hypothetical protein